MKTLIAKLDDTTYAKLQKLKEDKYPDKDWSEFFAYLCKDVKLTELSGDLISRATKENLMEMWVKNFSETLSYIKKGKTIAELVPPNPEKAPLGPAIVVGAGPSVWKHKHLEMLAKTDKAKKLTVIPTDRMVAPCLKAGVTPDKFAEWISVGVDGSPVISKWYDDPIVKEYGDKIKVCIITSTHPKVVKVLRKNKVKNVYWYNPIYDDWRDNESYTRLQRIMTKSQKTPQGIPSLSCLGNAGAASWVLGHALLRKSPICLLGIDFGYEEGTPLEKTQYFSGFMETAHGNVELVKTAYKTYYNPYWKCKAITDPVFDHYRNAFLDSVKQTPSFVETYNCTEGGCIFGDGIPCMMFEDFLKYCDNPEELRKHVLKAD